MVVWRVNGWQPKGDASLVDPQRLDDVNQHATNHSRTLMKSVAQVILGLCVALAAMSALQVSVGVAALLDFKDQAWCQVVWGLLLAALLGFNGKHNLTRHSSFWVTASMLSLATAFAIMPSGDSWNDTIPLHRYWLPLIAMAAIANHWALRQLVVRGAGRWVALVALASLAGPLLLCAASYSALLNVCLAVSTAVAVIAIVAAFGAVTDVQGILLPTVLCAASMSGSARFFSYDEPSAFNYGLAMFMPVLVDALDRPLHRQPTWQRVLVAGAVCSLAVLVLGYRIMGPSNEEW